jgi:serine protease Do
MGVGFAIPSEMAQYAMESIIDKGFVSRGYLGAMIQDLSEELARSFNYESTRGVLIGDVVEDSPAHEAGLKSGDIVVEYNGQSMESANELRNAVASTEPGSRATMEIFRDGQRRTLNVDIAQLDQDKVAATLGGTTGESASDLGMTVEALTPQMASQLGLEGATGVVVSQVEPGSLAAQVGLERGDLVVSVGDQEIQSVSDFQEAMSKQDIKQGVRFQVMREGVKRFLFIRSQ